MSDTDGVEVLDYSALVPCPPLHGPWPDRHALTCVCCSTVLELLVDQRQTVNGVDIAISLDKGAVIATAGSGLGWLLVGDVHRMSWCCRECARVALDYASAEVVDAVYRWRRWSAIIVECREGVPGWRGGRR